MRVATLLPVLLITLAGAWPAAATGTLDCVAEDATARIDVHGIVPYGMGAPLLQVAAEITSELPDIGTDLTTTRFEAEDQVQYWLDDVSLNVLFYKERVGDGPFGSTTLVIKTTRGNGDEEGTYTGSYDITGYDMPEGGGEGLVVHAKGMVECFAG